MIEENTELYTTFGMDFSIADAFGVEAIKDTYKNGLEYALSDAKYFAEFVMVLNHKIWEWYQVNEEIARVYDTLWRKADNMINDKHFSKEEIRYILNYLD